MSVKDLGDTATKAAMKNVKDPGKTATMTDRAGRKEAIYRLRCCRGYRDGNVR
jgi:hypothetical protein